MSLSSNYSFQPKLFSQKKIINIILNLKKKNLSNVPWPQGQSHGLRLIESYVYSLFCLVFPSFFPLYFQLYRFTTLIPNLFHHPPMTYLLTSDNEDDGDHNNEAPISSYVAIGCADLHWFDVYLFMRTTQWDINEIIVAWS